MLIGSEAILITMILDITDAKFFNFHWLTILIFVDHQMKQRQQLTKNGIKCVLRER